MTTIDHAAEARKHIDWVHEWQSYEGDTPEANLANAGIAQAHATLALVDAQREANEIARIQIMLTLPDTPEALRESASTDVAAKALLERMFKGLGL